MGVSETVQRELMATLNNALFVVDARVRRDSDIVCASTRIFSARRLGYSLRETRILA